MKFKMKKNNKYFTNQQIIIISLIIKNNNFKTIINFNSKIMKINNKINKYN